MKVYLLSALLVIFHHTANSQHGHHLVCRVCDGVLDRTKCEEKRCPDSQLVRCGARAIQFNDGIKYWEHCIYEHNCNGNDLRIEQLHGGKLLCAKCCNDDNCNAKLCHQRHHHYQDYSCLNCSGTDSLKHCTQHSTCHRDEICAVRAVKHGKSVKFYGFCTDVNNCRHEDLISHNLHGGTTVCGKCCQGDNCNRDLCEDSRHNEHSVTTTQEPTTTLETTTTKAPKHNSSCVTCFDVDSFDKCTSIEHCLLGEDCSVIVTEDRTGHHHIYAGCARRHFHPRSCHRDTYGIHLDETIVCHQCCHSDLCNSQLCRNATITETPTSAKPTTDTTTTTTFPTSATTVITATTTKYAPTTITTPRDTTPTTSTTPALTTPGATTTVSTEPTTSTSALATYPVTTERPPLFCLSCKNVSSFFDCIETEICDHKQKCSLYVYQLGNGNTFHGGCIPANICHPHLFSKDMLCIQCCEDDNCNKDLCPEYMTTTKEMTTTLKAATTVKLTTTTTKLPTSTTPTTPTTTKTTTTTPIATTSIADTTTIPPTTHSHNMPKKVDCEVCDGGICGYIPGNDPVHACPSNKPYCMNTVVNAVSGRKTYTKRCANYHDCETKWWEESSDQTTCTGFNPLTPYFSKFTCSYCCVKSRCNSKIFPDPDTLFQGRS